MKINYILNLKAMEKFEQLVRLPNTNENFRKGLLNAIRALNDTYLFVDSLVLSLMLIALNQDVLRHLIHLGLPERSMCHVRLKRCWYH